jgi:uncharacterized protein YndB with AHSA1/START domain
MTDLPFTLERKVVIQAAPETVFRYFTDSARWAAWWGAGSTIDAMPGGKVYIRYPNGVEASGEVMEVEAPRRIVFTFGYASGKPMGPGSSRVTIRLEEDGDHTRLHLLHELTDAEAREAHVAGWRFQLSLFGNLVANEVFADAAKTVDAWFDAWAIADNAARESALAAIVTPEVRFRDRYAVFEGLGDLALHTEAVLKFMPGVTMGRRGDIRHCQGAVLADWEAKGMSGTNVFVFRPDGKDRGCDGVHKSVSRDFGGSDAGWRDEGGSL